MHRPIIAIAAVAFAASPTARERDVTFRSGAVTVHATVRIPGHVRGLVPAALIIAGSGPTDRNGNSPAFAGVPADTGRYLADQLDAAGYASLRYDKLTSGATGLGPYQISDIANLTFQETFLKNAQDALAYLAAQPEVDPKRLTVMGHSEGGMIALAVADDPGSAPTPARLVLVEPQYAPMIDILDVQLSDQIQGAATTGLITGQQGQALTAWLRAGLDATRTGAPFPDPLTPPFPDATGAVAQFQAAISPLAYSKINRRMLQTENQLDPKALAARVTEPHSVLVTCGTKDLNTPCDQVRPLA
ncbi:MAG: alpha/beta fold hydrolase, partial [Actinomycetes bacterium]